MHALHSQAAVTLAGLIGLTSVFFVCRRAESEPAPVQFANAVEARDFFEANGLHCHDGTPGAVPGCGNYYIANHPISEDDHLQACCRLHSRRHARMARCPLGCPNPWQQRSPGPDDRQCPRENAGIWGNIIVAGDENLIRLDQTRFHEE